jgi:Pentapeptide repeats (8 copies)
MKIDILHRATGEVLYSHEQEGNTVRLTVENALREKVRLIGANLRVADLSGADLSGARLSGAIYGDATMGKRIVQLSGLRWPICIFDNHIKIGCEMHTVEAWRSFSDDYIMAMNIDALEFWEKCKAIILGIAEAR